MSHNFFSIGLKCLGPKFLRSEVSGNSADPRVRVRLRVRVSADPHFLAPRDTGLHHPL